MATSSRIKKNDLLITASVFFALATLSIVARIAVKLHHRHAFGLDDLFIFFGAICLAAATGLYFSQLDDFYLGTAARNDPTLAHYIPPARIQSLVEAKANAYTVSAMVLMWTTAFCAKLSFLVFLKQIVEPLRRLRVCCVVAIAVCTGVWVYMVIEPFIACPYFKRDSAKCFARSLEDRFQILTHLGTALDILTTLMIISIAVLVLRHVQIAFRQKLAVAALPSLSLVMLVAAVVRSSSIHGTTSRSHDSPWLMLWVHIEAALAITTVSLAAFPTILIFQGEGGRMEVHTTHSSSPWFAVGREWKKGSRPTTEDSGEEKDLGLVEVLRATPIKGSADGGGDGKEEAKVKIKEIPKNLDLGRAQRWVDGVGEDPWVTSPTWLKLESGEVEKGRTRDEARCGRDKRSNE